MERAQLPPVLSPRAPLRVMAPAGAVARGWGDFQLLAAVDGQPLGQLLCSWRALRSSSLGRAALLSFGAIRVSLAHEPRAVLAAFGEALASGVQARARREPCVVWCVRGHPFHAPVLHALAARAEPSHHEYTALGVCVTRELDRCFWEMNGARRLPLSLRLFF